MDSLSLGFDAKRAFHNWTGLGVYSRVLLKHLSRDFPEHAYHVFSPAGNGGGTTNLYTRPPFVPHFYEGPKLFAAPWRSFRIGRKAQQAGVDLYHGLSHELPTGLRQLGIRSVVTIHDLIFERFPEHYPWIDRKLYRRKIQHSCQVADRIVAISQASKQDLVDLYHINPEKITVIYQTCEDLFWTRVSCEETNKEVLPYDLPTEYILTVGSGRRKNLLSILKALQLIKSPPLVVVGHSQPTQTVRNAIVQYKLTDRVIFLRNVPSEHLPALYQKASLFVFPSLYEGFGIPVLEALLSGTPVVTSQESALPEAGGPKTRYVDPIHPAEMAHAIAEVLQDSSQQNEMIQAGYDYAKLFNPTFLSKQWMELYQSVLDQ